jgi:hypothetical protein
MVMVMDIENGNECFVGRLKHSRSPEILLYTHDRQKNSPWTTDTQERP